MKTNGIAISLNRTTFDGGHNFDRRTWMGKDLIKRIKERALITESEYPEHYLGLRCKDIEVLFTTENLNLN